MIIACPFCDKKFNVDASLIPFKGRDLQCGFCKKKWHYKADNIKLQNINKTKETKIKKIDLQESIPINADKIISDAENIEQKNVLSTDRIKSNYKFLNLLFVFIISFTAFILMLDTFKLQINNVLPGFNFLLLNFYESIKDFYLFFKDLLE